MPKHSNETPFICLDCGKGFKWKHGLTSHLVVHSNEKKLLCDECGYSTSHLKTLRAHQLSHTGELLRCSSTGCMYSTRRKENLKIHLITHKNETPFVCEVCGHRFSQNKNLKRHALLHFAKNLHKCPHCPFTSHRTDKLKEHIGRQHTEKPLQLELSEDVQSSLLKDEDGVSSMMDDMPDVGFGNEKKKQKPRSKAKIEKKTMRLTAVRPILPKLEIRND